METFYLPWWLTNFVEVYSKVIHFVVVGVVRFLAVVLETLGFAFRVECFGARVSAVEAVEAVVRFFEIVVLDNLQGLAV